MTAANPAPGDLLGGYRIDRVVGRGGMGVVYQATHLALGRLVALKVIAPELALNPDFRARFERESRMAAAIDHPNIVPVYEAGQIDGLAFIALRFIDGVDLRTVLKAEHRLPPAQAAGVVAQIADALDAAHAHGLVHRDIKPGNVLVTGAPAAPHCYLTDFGLTKHATSHSDLTATGQWMGTLDYVAPEQVEGRAIDARVDVYALGCLFFEALTGSVPFPRESDVAKLYAHVHEPPPRASAHTPGLAPEMDAVIARALAKHPDERYPSAGDLARAMYAALSGREASQPERSVAAGAAAPEFSRGGTHVDPVVRQPFPNAAATPAYAAPPLTPSGWTPTTQPLPDRGRGGMAVAIVVAALLLAAGGVAAAVIATKSGGGSPMSASSGSGSSVGVTSRPSTSVSSAPETTNTTPSAVDGIDLQPYATQSYSAQVPRSWNLVQDYERQPRRRHVSKWVAPNGTSVLIDTTSNASGDAAQSARSLEKDYRKLGGYRRLTFRPLLSGSDDAFEWGYVDPSTQHRKVDVFVYRGGDGFAVLGEASSPSEYRHVQRLALAMTDSIAAP
jgi:hypothetical protein